MKDYVQGMGAYFALLYDNLYISEIALDAFYEDQKAGNVCYWIAKKHQCKRFAKMALLQLRDWAKQHT